MPSVSAEISLRKLSLTWKTKAGPLLMHFECFSFLAILRFVPLLCSRILTCFPLRV